MHLYKVERTATALLAYEEGEPPLLAVELKPLASMELAMGMGEAGVVLCTGGADQIFVGAADRIVRTTWSLTPTRSLRLPNLYAYLCTWA